MPGLFRRAYFEYHAHVRLRFKLASGLGAPWTRDGGIPQEVPFEYDVRCSFISALVPLFVCSGGGSALNVCLGIRTCSWVLLGSPLDMFGWLVRSLRLVSVSFLVRLGRFGKMLREWVLSLDGDKWSVKFDVCDLGGHLDTTCRGWSSTLAARVRLVISRLVLIFALSLDFHGRVRVVKSMYLPAALHGIESSLLASDCLQSFGLLFIRLSGLVANLWLMLVLFLICWMGPLVVTLCFVWSLSVFVYFVGTWLFGLLRLVGFIVFWRWLVKVVLGMVLFIFFLVVPLKLVFGGILMLEAWFAHAEQFGISHSTFRAAILDAWRDKVAAESFVGELVFGVVLFWIFMALCSSSILLMFEKEIRVCFVASWLVVSGMVSFLVGFVIRPIPCRFCGAPDGDGHLFWECTFPPLVEIREKS